CKVFECTVVGIRRALEPFSDDARHDRDGADGRQRSLELAAHLGRLQWTTCGDHRDAKSGTAHQNPLPPPPPLPPPLEPPPPEPDELGLDDMLLAAALDMVLMLFEKLETLNGPVPPEYHCGGSR